MAKTDIKDKDEVSETNKGGKKDLKAGGKIWTGHEEAMKKALALLEQSGLPLGILPLENVIELGFVESTGYLWITQKAKVEHLFKLITKQVSYGEEIKGYVEKDRIRKLTGVKAKELFLWAPVGDIIVNGDQINFKSFAGITKTFPAEAFAPGQ